MEHKSLALALVSVFSTAMGLAQVAPPDAGTLMQQVPRLEPLRRPGAMTAPEAAAKPAARPAGPQVQVKRFKVQGNTLLSSEQLAASLLPFLQKTLNLAQLEQAAQAVAQRYRQDGWVVSAYLPAQDITQGEVLIQIDEARLGALQFNAPEGLRGPQAQARRYFDTLLQTGQPLNADDVERAQMLGNELLGLDINTRFKKSQALGATDVDVGLRDKPLLAMDVFADNGGAHSTGSQRLNAMLEWRNPLASGDLWNMAFMHSQGADSARVGLGVPVGPHGWRVGASVSHYGYRLISPEFSALDLTGSVNSIGLDASYPLLRQRERSLSLLLNADHKNLDNRSHGNITSRYATQALGMALQGRQSDDWLGQGGSTFGQLGWSSGRINLNGSPTQATDAAGPQTEGNFNKMRAQLSRAQNLSARWTLQLSHTQQWASKNLDSSEKFFIGGPDSVRAFPLSEAGGAEGRLSTAELQWRVDGALTLIGFYDQGQVRVNVNPYSNSPTPNRIRLEGAGLGLQWRATNGLAIKATWARRLQDNPHPTTSGKDQDNTLLRDRIWLSALYSF